MLINRKACEQSFLEPGTERIYCSMSVSLTKEEFLKRLTERQDFFILAVNHDFTSFKSKIRADITINPDVPHKPEVNLVVDEFANELVKKSIRRAVDLVYQDMD
jgi:hypothetical protein